METVAVRLWLYFKFTFVQYCTLLCTVVTLSNSIMSHLGIMEVVGSVVGKVAGVIIYRPSIRTDRSFDTCNP